ncbi:NAD(P)-dependent oxidoreductase [Megasphaera sueciensis]|uniref:NAD(P)-dependent oxidoreductase n=1 Tax=Megasphaera sueciensis TaxID=349094 RepID=UPI003D0668F0
MAGKAHKIIVFYLYYYKRKKELFKMKIGFLGLGVMGLPMAKNVIKKSGCELYGFDVVQERLDELEAAGGHAISDQTEIYKNCDVIMQMLPTHPIIINSIEKAIAYGKPGNIIIDLSSTAPNIIIDMYQKVKAAGMSLLDSPVSGGNPKAIDGTLAIMTGGDKDIYDRVEPLLQCMGIPVYTGGTGSGDVTKLVNNTIAGAYMVAVAEGYAFAAKAGIDLQTTFEATRYGFAGGPAYENKVPKMLARDYEPGARIAVHRKDIINAKHYAHHLDIDLPMTDVVLMVMDWMNDNGHINEDQAAMVKYFEEKMNVKVGKENK